MAEISRLSAVPAESKEFGALPEEAGPSRAQNVEALVNVKPNHGSLKLFVSIEVIFVWFWKPK